MKTKCVGIIIPVNQATTHGVHLLIEAVVDDGDKLTPCIIQAGWTITDGAVNKGYAMGRNTDLPEPSAGSHEGNPMLILPLGEFGHATVNLVTADDKVISNTTLRFKSVTEVPDSYIGLTDKTVGGRGLATPGVVIPLSSTLVPDGFIAYHGQAFDPVVYPELAKLYPTGTMPDLRDTFLREGDVVGKRVPQSVGPITFKGIPYPPHNHRTPRNNYYGSSGNTLGQRSSGSYNELSGSLANAVTMVSAGTPAGSITGTGEVTQPKCVVVNFITACK